MANIGSSGRGRFSDRLKRIRYYRVYRKKKIRDDNSEISYKNFLKVLAVIPLVVVDNVFDKPAHKDEKHVGSKVIDLTEKPPEIPLDRSERKQKNRKKIEQIDVDVVKKTQNKFFKSSWIPFKKKVKSGAKYESAPQVLPVSDAKEEIKEDIQEQDVSEKKAAQVKEDSRQDNNIQIDGISAAKKLEKKILDLIKKDLIRVMNMLEIYESELYVLSEINNDERTLDECRRNLAEVRKILAQIEDLKRKYDYLRDSYDFEYLLEFDNAELVDKIIELRDMFGNNEVRATVADYKLLDVYKHLYVSVDQINENVHKIEREKEEQEQRLAERDIDFEKLKSDVYNIDRV